MFARGRVQPGARLVQDEQGRAGHEGAANEQTLPLALGKEKPGTVGQGTAFDLAQQAQAAAAVGGGHGAPKSDHGQFAADDSVQGRFVVWNPLANGGVDQADALAQLAPVGGA